MNFNPLDLLIGALAVWRVSAMLAYERGPFRLFARFRKAVGVFHYDSGEVEKDLATGEFTQLILCVWCSSPWLAGLWLLGYFFFPMPTMIVSTILALSAAGIIVEKINNG